MTLSTGGPPSWPARPKGHTSPGDQIHPAVDTSPPLHPECEGRTPAVWVEKAFDSTSAIKALFKSHKRLVCPTVHSVDTNAPSKQIPEMRHP